MLAQRLIMDGLDSLAARSVKALRGYDAEVLAPVRAALGGVGRADDHAADGAALRSLKASLGGELLQRMGRDALGERLAATLTIAHGLGYASTTEQVRGAERANAVRLAHAEPPELVTTMDFTPRTLDQAADWFARKTVLTSGQFERLSKVNRGRAFRIAGVHNARVLQTARNLIDDAIRTGGSYRDVRIALLDMFDAEGVERPGRAHLRLVFRQNVMSAYGAARQKALDDPDVVAGLPYRMYLTVGTGEPGVRNVRAEHAKLHGLIFAWDDEAWNHFTPPWGWGCRCFVVPISRRRAAREVVHTYRGGSIVATTVPPGEPKPKRTRIETDEDFDFPRDTFDERKFDTKGLDEELRRALAA